MEKLVAMFGDLPNDSKVKLAALGLIGAVVADAKSGGKVGKAFKVLVEAGANTHDTAYNKLSPDVAMTATATFNSLKSVLA